ncbi:MAG: S24 family peptidase [Gammaproteobacteria bacterium]
MSCAGSEPFALRVLGDSMAPEFEDGAIIIVEPGQVVESGCYVVAQYEGEYVLRRLTINGGRWLLEAVSDAYPGVEIPGPAAIKGRVIQKSGSRNARKRYV